MPEKRAVRRCDLTTIGLMVVLAGSSQAQIGTPIEQVETQKRVSRDQASTWGLTVTEWRQYQQVMSDQRGIWSPGLDPLTALGVSADTAAERDRYAELYVRTAFERTRKELAFQLAVDRAWARIYPDTQPFRPKTAVASTGEPVTRYALIVTADCLECEGVIAHRLAGMLGEATEGVDVHVVGTDGDDAVLRTWLSTQPDVRAALEAGRATLNHGSQFEDLGRLPVIYSKTGAGRWTREL